MSEEKGSYSIGRGDEALKKIFDRPIAYHRSFVDFGAGVTGAVLLSQLWYWTSRTKDPDGWIYKTQVEWQEETGLSRHEQDTARKHLREVGVIEEKLASVPARLYYRINVKKICEVLGIVQTSLPQSGKLDILIAANKDDEIKQTFNDTETTSEITTDKKIVVEKASTTTRRNLFSIAKVLSDVTGMDITKNRGRLFKEAKDYKDEEVEDILQIYGPGGAWYSDDWRGKKGDRPKLSDIRETWGKYKPVPVSNKKQVVKSDYHDGQWWMEYVDEP